MRASSTWGEVIYVLTAALVDLPRVLFAAAVVIVLVLTSVPAATVGWSADASRHVEKGDDLATRRLWRRATVAYTKAIEIDPGAADAYGGRCHTLRVARQLGRALADCERALELDPGHVGAYKQRGNVAPGSRARRDG
jgi:hypothetical protein